MDSSRLLAATPRRATFSDIPSLTLLFSQAFSTDPVMSYCIREDEARTPALQRFFSEFLTQRAIPYNHVWMADDASCAAAWLPAEGATIAGGLWDQIKSVGMYIQLCGFSRLLRAQALGDAMEKNHPHGPHFYLAFIAVSPSCQGQGLGSTLLQASLKHVDESGLPAYLENSNPKNQRLYERAGFVVRKDIAPQGAPPLIGMWREGAKRED